MTSFLVADIGGTKTLVANARRGNDGWQWFHRERYASATYPDLNAILQAWLQQHATAVPLLRAGALAVAGPVSGTGEHAVALTTNLPWPPLRAAELGAWLRFPVALLNDFAAIGTCLDALGPDALLNLQQAPRTASGLRLVVGAGTGLGTCLVGPGPMGVVFSGEGGHADFAPADAEQADLAAWVRDRCGRCSREHLLSGSGILRLAEFAAARYGPADGAIPRALQAAEPAAEIQKLADSGHPVALRVVELFVRIYAGQVGDMALAALPWGGVYLAGGIAPRWREHFLQPAFRTAFARKEPMEPLLAALAVDLIVHPEPGLLGAAVAAERVATGQGEELP